MDNGQHAVEEANSNHNCHQNQLPKGWWKRHLKKEQNLNSAGRRNPSSEAPKENGNESTVPSEKPAEAENQLPRHKTRTYSEFYEKMAASMGVTCQMSDDCRCANCQGGYFDCEIDYGGKRVDGADGLSGCEATLVNTIAEQHSFCCIT